MRQFRIAALLLIAATPLAIAQNGNALPSVSQTPLAPAFDVISVKEFQPDTSHPVAFLGLMNTPDGVNSPSVTLSILLRAAYGYPKFPTDDRVVGLPDWAKTRYYAVAAKMSEDQSTAFNKLSKADQEKQRELMIQSLLVDRFKLKVHLESKQMSDYELVIAKGGPKLTEAPAGATPPRDGFKGPDGKPITGSFLRMAGPGKIIAQNFGVRDLALFLTQPVIRLGRPVMDKTSLTGSYNFTLNWTPDTALGPSSETHPSEDQGPSIFTALQEQLGLRLQPSTGAFDILVVDHIEPPSEN